MTLFNQEDYNRLSTLFRSDYPGYKPTTRELPNGDGVVDQGKKYLHVALKYNPPGWAVDLLEQAWVNCKLSALHRGCLHAALPTFYDSALRVLYYPAGEGSAEHTDFDLCTLNCFRSFDLGFPEMHIGEIGEMLGMGPAMPHSVPALDVPQFSIVFFGIPQHGLRLPDGRTVGEYLSERVSRSRVEVK